jgi:ATP-dependent 26S proteasome regulatory subunit
MRPAILCLNEIDSIARKRGGQVGEHAEDRRMITEFFNSFDRMPEVVVIGTTNEEAPYFDDALLRPDRLGNPIAMPLPKKAQRYEILQHFMKKLLHVSSDMTLPDCAFDQFSAMVSGATHDSPWPGGLLLLRKQRGLAGMNCVILLMRRLCLREMGVVMKLHGSILNSL